MIRILAVFACLACLTATAGADYYQYTDENGVRHFTENYADIPEEYRPDVGVHATIKSSDTGGAAPVTGAAGETALNEPETKITYESLTAKKAELDKEHAALIKRRDDLTLKPPQMDEDTYVKAVDQLNKDILAFQVKQKDFDSDVETYNAQITPEKDRPKQEQ